MRPGPAVLASFGASADPVSLPGGEGTAWRAGDGGAGRGRRRGGGPGGGGGAGGGRGGGPRAGAPARPADPGRPGGEGALPGGRAARRDRLLALLAARRAGPGRRRGGRADM